MDKNKTLEAILKAKKSHLDRMSQVRARINGNIGDELVLISKRECGFGEWFYGDERLKGMLGSEFYTKLEHLHTKWHMEYKKIYDICYESKNKQGFLSKIVGSKKVSQMDLDKAKSYYADLELTTGELIKAIDSSHRRLSALNESYFS